MNILIFTSWYPDKNSLVAGTFVKEQAKALKELGINVTVFYPYDKSIGENNIVCNIEDDIKTYRANTDYMNNSKISRINSIIKSLKFLKKIVKENNIDLIHSHVCYSSGFVAAFYKHFNKMPYVITEHMSTIPYYVEKKYNKLLFNFAYSNADAVICVSSFLRDELKKLGFDFKDKVISNVVDTESFKLELRKRDSNDFNILFVGSMDSSEVKGLNYFIPALHNYMKENPEYNINISFIGNGEKRVHYEKLCSELNIKNKCNFLGNIDKSEVSKYMNNCDFLVLPSIKETFGCVLIEAMACGKPVLGTKCGGPEDVVNEKVGVLVKSRDIKELEKGLDQIITNYDKFDFNYIRNYAVENYSSNAVANKLKRLYANILRK